VKETTHCSFGSGVSWSFKGKASGAQGALTVKNGIGGTTNLTLLGHFLAANGTAQSYHQYHRHADDHELHTVEQAFPGA
jgi:hypothetical protein